MTVARIFISNVIYVIEYLYNIQSENDDVYEIIDSWKKLPGLFLNIIKQAFLYLVYLAFFIGAFLLIIGILEWMSGWNEMSGKKNVIRGIILMLVALAPVIV